MSDPVYLAPGRGIYRHVGVGVSVPEMKGTVKSLRLWLRHGTDLPDAFDSDRGKVAHVATT